MPHSSSTRRARLGPLGVVSVLAVLATATTAHAQEPAAPAAGAEASSDDAMAEARKLFQTGVALLDDPDGARYEEAYHAFKKAYALSRSPKVLGNLGFCAFKLERDGEAIDAYQAYLREAKDIEERERTQIERDLATLTSSLARVRATTKHAGPDLQVVDQRILTRGAAVVNLYPLTSDTALRLRPGRHVLKVKSGAEESLPFEVNLEPGGQAAHDFVFPVKDAPVQAQAQTPTRSPSYAGPVLLGLVGVAAAGAGIVPGVLARGKVGDMEDACPGNVCPAGYDLAGERSSAKTLGTVADALFIGGGVAVGGALVWALLLPRGGNEPTTSAPAKAARLDVAPRAACGPTGCSVVLGGRF